jgi:hypothetical protein
MFRPGILLLLGAALHAQTIDTFHLPPKAVFPATMPRYPNVWFYVDSSLVKSHKEAVQLVTKRLRETMHLPEYFPPFDNPEGCDYEIRVEHLQPWIDPARRQLQHAHAFHMRYYYSAFASGDLQKVRIARGSSAKEFYRFAASAHYEVEHANPHHADVEECPVCGRAGEYATVKGNLVEQVHDPLGLELVLRGTIRGEKVSFEDWERRPVGSVNGLSDHLRVSISEFPGQTLDRNTYRIGFVVLEPKN